MYTELLSRYFLSVVNRLEHNYFLIQVLSGYTMMIQAILVYTCLHMLDVVINCCVKESNHVQFSVTLRLFIPLPSQLSHP